MAKRRMRRRRRMIRALEDFMTALCVLVLIAGSVYFVNEKLERDRVKSTNAELAAQFHAAEEAVQQDAEMPAPTAAATEAAEEAAAVALVRKPRQNPDAAQLGLEPNTPLGQAYLIPYKNKGAMECQFQIGYKGLIDLAYRNPQMQIIQAQAVYEHDYFEYELGLNPKLVHRPAMEDRGDIRLFYGLFKLTNGGFGFEVMSKSYMDAYAREYSKSFDSSCSPWKSNYTDMARKTVI